MRRPRALPLRYTPASGFGYGPLYIRGITVRIFVATTGAICIHIPLLFAIVFSRTPFALRHHLTTPCDRDAP